MFINNKFYVSKLINKAIYLHESCQQADIVSTITQKTTPRTISIFNNPLRPYHLPKTAISQHIVPYGVVKCLVQLNFHEAERGGECISF